MLSSFLLLFLLLYYHNKILISLVIY